MNHELQKPRVIALILEEMRADFSTELIQSALNAIPVHENIRLVVLAGKYLAPCWAAYAIIIPSTIPYSGWMISVRWTD